MNYRLLAITLAISIWWLGNLSTKYHYCVVYQYDPEAKVFVSFPVDVSYGVPDESTSEFIIRKACHQDSTVVFDAPIPMDWKARAQAVFSGVDFDKLDLAGVKEFMKDSRGFNGGYWEVGRLFIIFYTTPPDEALQKLNYYLVSAQGIHEFRPIALHGEVGFHLNYAGDGIERVTHWGRFVTPVDLVKGEPPAKFVLISKKKLAAPQKIKIRRINPDSSGAAPSFFALKTGDRLTYWYRFENGTEIKLETGDEPGPSKIYKPRAAIELSLEGENFKWLYVVWGSEMEEFWGPCMHFASLFRITDKLELLEISECECDV
jgi:hypothetical protein